MSKGITNQVLRHGMGSKLLKILFLMGYCDYINKDFFYTPLGYEGDGVNFNLNELNSYSPTEVLNPREEYLEMANRWDKTLNFKGLTINDVDRSSLTKLIHPGLPIEDEKLWPYFNNQNKLNIKNKFGIPKLTNTDSINVNIHIRRGDVTTADWTLDRWLDDEYYLNIIKDIESVLGDRCKINIHTQRGRHSGNFNKEKFSKYNIIYDDENLDDEIWVSLVNSDILVMGLSSYSYSAAILCEGICVYPEGNKVICGPKLCDNWVLADELKQKLKEKYEKSIDYGN